MEVRVYLKAKYKYIHTYNVTGPWTLDTYVQSVVGLDGKDETNLGWSVGEVEWEWSLRSGVVLMGKNEN